MYGMAPWWDAPENRAEVREKGSNGEGEGGGGRGRGGRVGKNQSKIFRLLLSSHKTVRATASTPKKALSTVSVSHLYYSVIQRAREAISG